MGLYTGQNLLQQTSFPGLAFSPPPAPESLLPVGLGAEFHLIPSGPAEGNEMIREISNRTQNISPGRWLAEAHTCFVAAWSDPDIP